jgi:HD-like signal output (HDOD) protein
VTRAAEIHAALEDVAPLPEIAVRMLQLVSDAQATADDILAMLRGDEELTRSVIKLSNSSIYELPCEVVDASQTVAYLGTRTLVRFVVALSTYPVFARAGGHEAGEAWRHALACGIAAQILSEMKGVGDPNGAFTAGVLHDIGSLVLAPYAEREVTALHAEIASCRRGFAQAEAHVLGIDHSAAGSKLADHWRLPRSLRHAIGHHHDPEFMPDADELTQLIHVADAITLQLGIGVGAEGLSYSACIDAVRRLHVSPDEVDRARLRILAELERSQDLLQLPETVCR